MRVLLEQNAASQQRDEQLQTQAEVARARVDQMEARVARAERDLERTTVRAPYAGSVVERRAHEGALAGPAPVLVLQEAGALEAILDVPEATPVPVRVGEPGAALRRRASPRRSRRWSRASPSASTRHAHLRGALRGRRRERRLKAGSYARAEIEAQREAPQPVAPRSALVTRDGRTFVLRVENGVAREVDVRSGVESGDVTEILSGRRRRGPRGERRGRAAPRRRRPARASRRPRAVRADRRRARARAMRLAELSIRRPVFAAMLNLGLVVLGLVSLSRLELKLEPDIDFPFAMVVTELRGASPETVEREVTDVLEEQINGIEGIQASSAPPPSRASRASTSSSGSSYDIDTKVQEVRDKVAARAAAAPGGRGGPRRREVRPVRGRLHDHRDGRPDRAARAHRLRRARREGAPRAHARAWAACSSSGAASARCASGSIRCGSRATGSPSRTSPTRCAARTPSSRAAASRAARASGRSPRRARRRPSPNSAR